MSDRPKTQRLTDAEIQAIKNSCIFVLELHPQLTARASMINICDDLLDSRKETAALRAEIATLRQQLAAARADETVGGAGETGA